MLAKVSQTMQFLETILSFSILKDKPLVFPKRHLPIRNTLDMRTHGRDRALACAALVIT